MIPLESELENREGDYDFFWEHLEPFEFVVGGNWDYDHGYFDKALDGERRKVYLRIPFKVIEGRFDAVSTNNHTLIRIGTPFVLKHEYEEGVDRGGDSGLFSGLVDQFQDPTDPDAPVQDKWVEAAKKVLDEALDGWYLG